MSGKVKSNILLVLVIVAVFTVFSLINGGTGIRLDFGDDTLTVKGPNRFSCSVSYDSIAALELVELVDPGAAVSGSENSGFRWGEWSSGAWGPYTLCAGKQADTAICVTTDEGQRLVFNYQNDETTARVFEMFSQLLAARRSA